MRTIYLVAPAGFMGPTGGLANPDGGKLHVHQRQKVSCHPLPDDE